MEKPRVCYVEYLVSHPIYLSREFHCVWAFRCPNPRVNIVAKFTKFMSEARQGRSLAECDPFGREPSKLIRDVNELVEYELESFVSFRSKSLLLINYRLFDLVRVEKAHRMQSCLKSRTLHNACRKVRFPSNAVSGFPVIKNSEFYETL
jgi:hypothetical protein